MNLYTKARCRNCGKEYICNVTSDIQYTKEEVLTTNSAVNIQYSHALHNCSQDDNSEDEGIVGIADVIGLIFKEN